MTLQPDPHRPADDTEQIYFEGTPQLRWQLLSGWPWVLIGLLVIAGPIILKFFDRNAPVRWWVYLAALVVGALFIFVPWVKAHTLRYKITNYRIDRESGLLSKKFDTLELWHVEDIQLTQSILSRLLSVGTIYIYSHDRTTDRLELKGIPNPKQVFDSLKQRIIAVKRQRGVLKMDTPIEEVPDSHSHG